LLLWGLLLRPVPRHPRAAVRQRDVLGAGWAPKVLCTPQRRTLHQQSSLHCMTIPYELSMCCHIFGSWPRFVKRGWFGGFAIFSRTRAGRRGRALPWGDHGPSAPGTCPASCGLCRTLRRCAGPTRALVPGSARESPWALPRSLPSLASVRGNLPSWPGSTAWPHPIRYIALGGSRWRVGQKAFTIPTEIGNAIFIQAGRNWEGRNSRSRSITANARCRATVGAGCAGTGLLDRGQTYSAMSQLLWTARGL